MILPPPAVGVVGYTANCYNIAMRIFRSHLPFLVVAISLDAAAVGMVLVRSPVVGEMTSVPAVMGRRYWTELRSGPYADPAWDLGEKDRKTGLSDLPLFRDAALFHGTGVHDPTNPLFATWRKVADNFPRGIRDGDWLRLEANAKPDRPVSVGFSAKRSKRAQAGSIDLDLDDFSAWRHRHPNLVALAIGSEWVNDIYNMDALIRNGTCWLFGRHATITDIFGSQKACDEVKARLFCFPQTHAGMLRRARAYFDRQLALNWNAAELAYLLRECFCVDHVAAAWGAKMIGVETTNTSGGGDAEFRWDVQAFFARGASRQFAVPWKWYVAQYVDGFRADGRYEYTIMCDNWPSPDPHLRPTGGCSPSLVNRICHYAYLNGANFVQIENWERHLLRPGEDGARVLSGRGEDMAAYHDFTVAHPNRGETYAPVAILLPFDQGYTYCGGWNWRSREIGYRPGDHMVDGIFFTIVPGFERGKEIRAGREFNLHNTRHPMMYDVLTPDSPQPQDIFLARLSAYPAAILAGEYRDAAAFWPTICEYVRGGGTLLAPRALLADGKLERLSSVASVPVNNADGVRLADSYDIGKGRLIVSVSDWMTPPVGNPARTIPDVLAGRRRFPEIEFFLERFRDELFPFSVSGSCLYGANRTADGWWLWALNNDGVTKFTDMFALIDESKAHALEIDLKGIAADEVRELATGRKVAVRNGRFRWTVPAGKLAVFEIADRKERCAK